MDFLRNRQQWADGFVPQPFRGAAWSDFPVATDGRRELVQRVQVYRDELLAGSRRPLVLYGPCNTGKTMLASLVWKDIVAHLADRLEIDEAVAAGTADHAVWVNGASIPEIVKLGDERHTGFHVTSSHLSTAFLGVIDDLDKCPPGWSSALYKILDARLCVHRLPTVLTMNLSPRQFVAKYGEEHGRPIWSRLERAGAVVIKVIMEEQKS